MMMIRFEVIVETTRIIGTIICIYFIFDVAL